MTARSIVVALALGFASFNSLLPGAAAEEAKKQGEVAAKLTSEEAIEEALASKVTLDLQDTPLKDVVDFLKDLKNINIQIDRKALEDAGQAEDTPVTLSISDVTLRTALRLMLGSQHDLTYIIKNEVLLITTPEKAFAQQLLKSYDVHDLVTATDSFNEKKYEPEALLNLVQATILPTAWDSVGGPGQINHFDGVLIVSQQAEAQEQVEDLLAAIRKVRASQEKQSAGEPAWADKLEPEMQPLEAALTKKVSLDFSETRLSDVAEFLKDTHKLPIFIDIKALENAGQSADTPVSIHVKGITLASALRFLLEPQDLTYYVRGEVLVITTREIVCGGLRTRVYPIRDLVKHEARDAGSDPEEAAETLMRMITSTVAPTSWSEVGGPGAAVPLASAGVLVISQTDEVFPKIDKLLALVRKSQAMRDKVDAKAEPARSQVKSPLRTKIYVVVTAADLTYSDELASQLVELVPELVASETWQAQGALIRACGNKLVVRQTADVQKQVAKLLKELDVDAQAALIAPAP